MQTQQIPVSAVQWQHFLNFINWDQLLMTLAEKVLILILFTLLLLIARKIGKVLIEHAFKRYQEKYRDTVAEKRVHTFYTLSQNAFNYSLWFFWIYSILSTLGVPVGTLVASAGVFSLALGLGAQGFVTDVVSGFFILLERQLEVGEYVQINNIRGTITAVGLRTTQIVGDDGTLNFIPNRSITTIANMSRNNMTAMIQISILPETPIEAMIKIIKAVNTREVPNYPNIINDPKIIGTVTLPDGKLVFQVNITTKNGAQAEISHRFLAMYLSELNKNDIQLPSSPTTVQKSS